MRQPERVSQPLNLLTRLNRFVRVIEERVSRGATQVKAYQLNYHFKNIACVLILKLFWKFNIQILGMSIAFFDIGGIYIHNFLYSM